MRIDMASRATIVFIHTGFSSYLYDTLTVAKAGNPNADCYLLGDSKNVEVANECGWSHIFFEGLISHENDFDATILGHESRSEINNYDVHAWR
jgi:hypothetical protein